jgi:hypothetical protein
MPILLRANKRHEQITRLHAPRIDLNSLHKGVPVQPPVHIECLQQLAQSLHGQLLFSLPAIPCGGEAI